MSDDIIITSEVLFEEFMRIYLKLDKNKWYNVLFEDAHRKQEHPTAKVTN